MKKTALVSLVLICIVTLMQAQDFSSEALSRHAVERRAIEAIVWSTPAVNFDLMYQAMVRDAKAGDRDSPSWSRGGDAKVR